jgi:hypothetical protein
MLQVTDELITAPASLRRTIVDKHICGLVTAHIWHALVQCTCTLQAHVLVDKQLGSFDVSIRQHTSAYVSIRQQTCKLQAQILVDKQVG